MTKNARGPHRSIALPVYVGIECANLDCDHDSACPMTTTPVCQECLRIAEAAAPGWSENNFVLDLVAWPCSAVPPIPGDFWGQIEHQLARVKAEKPENFTQLREILLDPVYDKVQRDVHLNGERTFGVDEAFFAGSGGDSTLASALQAAGWELLDHKAPYYYARQNTRTGHVLTYIEGDVVAGNQIDRKTR